MSIATDLTRIETAKSNIKTSIQNKGVTVPTTTKIDGYSALIDKITDLKGETRTLYPTGSDQTITPSTGKNGITSISLKKVTTANLSAANIANGVTVKVGRADDDDAIASVTGTAVLLAGEERSVTLNSSSASYTPSSGKNGITKITVTASSGTMTVKGTTPSMTGAWTEDYDAQGNNAYVVTATAPAPTSVTAIAGWVTSVTRNSGGANTFAVPNGAVSGGGLSGGGSLSGSKEFSPTASASATGSSIALTSTTNPSGYYISVTGGSAAIASTTVLSGSKSVTRAAITKTAGYIQAGTYAAEDSKTVTATASANVKASSTTVYYNLSTETKTVTPSTSSQDITPTTNKLLSKVTVNAIPSDYIIPSGNVEISSQGSSSSPINVKSYSGAYVKSGTMTVKGTTPSMSAAITAVSGVNKYRVTATAPAPTSVTATAGWVSSVTRNAGTSGTYDIPLATFDFADGEVGCLTAGYVVDGKVLDVTAATTGTSNSGTNVSTITPGTSTQYVNITAGYTSAKKWTISGSSELKASNIKKNVSIFGVTGTLATGTGTASWEYSNSPLTSGIQNYLTAGRTYVIKMGAGGMMVGSSMVGVNCTIYVRSKSGSTVSVYCYRHGNYSSVLSGNISDYEIGGGIYDMT